MRPLQVNMGNVILLKAPTQKQLETFKKEIVVFGFELLDNKKQKLIEQVKTLLIKKVQQEDIEEHFSISELDDNKCHCCSKGKKT